MTRGKVSVGTTIAGSGEHENGRGGQGKTVSLGGLASWHALLVILCLETNPGA